MPAEFGDYQVLCEIGRGGMGIVYKAEHKESKRLVAIKQLVLENIDPGKEREFKDRFHREATTVQRLAHPNIVAVFDVPLDADNYYYVMEFLEGHSLRQELGKRGGRLSPQELLPVLAQVVEALSYAHSLNVVHRDVKPDNIFILPDGRVKITDFGIARTAEYEQTHLTKTGVMMGTLAYVSPEQLQDAKTVDHRADIFSLGVVSYEALSGQLPFTGEGLAQTIVQIVSREEKPLHITNSMIPVGVSAAIAKAMRKKARDRFRSVKDFIREYTAALENVGSAPVREAQSAPSFPSMSAHPDISRKAKMEDSLAGQAIIMPEIQSGVMPNGLSDSAQGSYPDALTKTMVYGTGINQEQNVPNMQLPKTQASNVDAGTMARQQEYKPISLLLEIKTYGPNKTPLTEPAVVCQRPGGFLVADYASRNVHIYALDGHWLSALTPRPDSANTRTTGGAFTKPSGLAIDAKGRIYASDSSDHMIRVYDSKGVFVKEFKNIQGREGGVQSITLDSTGILYASDPENACIQVFQSDLGLWMRKLEYKVGADQLQLPSGLCTDRLNQIYCADYGSSRIYVFNKSGNFVRSFGGRGTSNGLFNVPRSVAVDKNDKIYVLDSMNNRIQVFGPTGDWVYSFGGRGSEPDKLISPSGICIDSLNSRLYVADRGNHRVLVFQLNLD
jgi:serine/threonine protein kinase/sugar lactone lactonase YvrE